MLACFCIFSSCPSFHTLPICCPQSIPRSLRRPGNGSLLKPAAVTLASQETSPVRLTAAIVCVLTLGSPGQCGGALVPLNAAANQFKSSAPFFTSVAQGCRRSQDRGYGRGVCLQDYEVPQKLLFQVIQFTGLGFSKFGKESERLSSLILRSLGVNTECKECLPNLMVIYQKSYVQLRWCFFWNSIIIYVTEALVCIPKNNRVLQPYFCCQFGKEYHLKCKYSISLFSESKPLPQHMQSLANPFTSIFMSL